MKMKYLLLQPILKTIVRYLKRITRLFIMVCGIVLVFTLILSFTDIPYWQYYWLGTHHCELEKEPDYIVLLGGGGMPSPDGLIRSYYAAGAWQRAPKAKVIVAVPSDSSNQFGSPEVQLRHELIMRDVDSAIIQFERDGFNTYSQAVNIVALFDKDALDTVSLRLVTTPEHMLRAVKVFKKAGFLYVGGFPAFESGLDEKKLISPDKEEAVRLNLRYNMWSYMRYEIIVVREYLAIVYYKLKGWI
jgi:uncharacterized SAM-binding protein YcdF (DUF218 family)